MAASSRVADAMREFVSERVWEARPPLEGETDATAKRRTALVSSQLMGLAFTRYILRVPPIATASFGKHDFPLWQVDSPDRAVVAGEIKGHWMWIVLWPETAGTLLIEPIGLRDLRDPGMDLDLPFGAPSLRLARSDAS